MDVIAAYRDLGSYRGAAALCGMTPRTVKRIIDAAEAGTVPERAERAHNYDAFAELITARIEATKGRNSAKRLLPAARAAGYSGSARNLRRLVAEAKVAWRAEHHRIFRPAVWAPGDVLAIDWGAEGRLHVFCAVLAWSRVRFIAFADNERQETTLGLLAQCFEAIGGVPQVVLADRMGCLKGGVVANVVVPAPGYVAFAQHYGFRPDFCEAADPQSKGLVENLVGYAKSDLLAVGEVHAGDIDAANVAAVAWCEEVNTTKHSEISAIPAERLITEQSLLRPLPSLRPSLAKRVTRKVDALSTVRFGSARYSVPTWHVGRQVQLEISGTNIQIIDLGEVIATHAIVAPGESSIADEHYGGPRPERLGLCNERAVVSAEVPDELDAALTAGLRRLKLAEIRKVGPDVLATAKTQRWKPEVLLSTLVEAEIAARDASNARARMKAAAFPVRKSLDEFDVAASSVPRQSFDYLASLEWISAKENLCLVGPPGTGKSHLLVALGIAAVEENKRVRYFAAADLVETLYRGMADNSVGKVIESLLRFDLVIIDVIGFVPLDAVGSQLFFRFVAAAYERRSLAIASHWPFEEWGRFLPEHTTAVSLLDRLLHHSVVIVTEGESFRMREAKSKGGARAQKSA